MAANQTFSLQRSKIPPRLSDASFKKHEIGNPLLVPPFDNTGVAGMNKIDVYNPRQSFISYNKLLTIDSAITPNEYNQINHLMLNTFEHIEKAWKKLGAELIDMKIEVGYDSETGNLMIADVVDNDSWRVWWNGDKTEQLDKQSYRDGESIDSVLDKYHRVTEYVSKFND